MSHYVLIRTPDATLLSGSALIRAADAEQVGSIAELLAALSAERVALPAEREAARAEGAAAGREEGREQGRAEALEENAERLAAALRALAARRREDRAEATELAIAIARRVLPQVAGDALLPSLIETAASELEDEQPHAVHVRPEEVDGVAAALEGTGLRVETDDALPPGHARLVTRAGTAEAGLDARLDVLRDALRG